MKKYNLFISLFILGTSLFAQQNPTGNPPTNPNNPSQTAQSAWYRGGNQPVSTGSNNNIFGTNWNSPIYTVTEGVIRTRLNGRLTANINSVNQNVTGYFGIGLNNYFATQTPMAMLHLEGPNNSGNMTGFGWRAWMRTGTFAEMIVFFIV